MIINRLTKRLIIDQNPAWILKFTYSYLSAPYETPSLTRSKYNKLAGGEVNEEKTDNEYQEMDMITKTEDEYNDI